MSNVAAGLVAAEFARADGSVGTFNGVHSFLAMQSIAMLGDEEQRERWLPAMARMERIGAFGPHRARARLDAVGLETSARRDGDSYVLNGQKKWIGNGTSPTT
jgi:glutaryl-CoA dehydrogenase